MKSGLIEIKQRRFDIIDKKAIRAKAAIQKAEDQAIFDAIADAMIPKGVVKVKDEENLGQAFDPDTISVTLLCGEKRRKDDD